MNFIVRGGLNSDEAFIVDSWIRNYEEEGTWRLRKERTREILWHDTTKILIACLPDDENAILGWCVTQYPRVLFTYVRVDVRHNGIARKLTEGLVCTRKK